MKRHLVGMGCLLGMVLMLAGCKIDEASPAGQGQAAAGAPAQGAAPEANTTPSWPGAGPNAQMGEAFGEMNRLAVGTLCLQSTEHPVTAEQAATLLPLWQSLQSAMQSQGTDGTPGAPIDDMQISPILDNIKAAMTPEQTGIIDNLTQEQMTTVYQQQGMEFARFGGPPGNGTPGPGDSTRGPRPGGQGPGNGTPWPTPGEGTFWPGPGGGTLSPEQEATFQARRESGGGRGFFFNPMIDAVIKMLQGLTGQ